MIVNGKKYCPCCSKYKEISLFDKIFCRSDGLRAYCKKCESKKRIGNSSYFTEYTRKWLKNNPEKYALFLKRNYEYQKKYPERTKARNATNYAIRSGKLIRQPCKVCGDIKVDAHHWHGYDKEHELDVQWLCRKHHAGTDRTKIYR